jgi:hypothetical protein
LEDFIDQEVTLLFIIELEDIGNFSKELKITDFLLGYGKKKKKHQRWKKRDFIVR